MTTVSELIKLLSVYPNDMVITNEQNQPFIHIVNNGDDIILSTIKPIGYCNRTDTYVYPSIIKGYSAFCPELDEDLFGNEWTPLRKKKEK